MIVVCSYVSEAQWPSISGGGDEVKYRYSFRTESPKHFTADKGDRFEVTIESATKRPYKVGHVYDFKEPFPKVTK